jgi:geranylgeranyl diphosphate/geranylgeranyl-bacteriochlorophyllide a reductase
LTPDVAVVGAGPAGAWTACQLARAGARVTIFDPTHPREKACGGGVTGRALAMVSDTIRGCLTPTLVTHARFGDAVVPLDGEALVVASRASFDAALLAAAERAGASVNRSRVVDVQVDRDHVDVLTASGRHRASFLVGADGANSLVRRRVTRAFRRDQLSIATGFYARGVTSHEIVVEFVSDPPGYIWSFPRPDHLAIGICAQADAGVTATALRDRTARWIERTGIARRAALIPYSWPIPSLTAADFATLDVAGPRWLLIGDAAGLVDPITREGIFCALRSAHAAASALMAREPSAAYTARLQVDIVPELGRAARLKSGFFTPPFVQLLITALERSAAIRAVMADLIAGRQSYRALKWRLVKTFEVGLAWQAISARNSRPAL